MSTLMKLDDVDYLKQVREQYENLPYPPRDPAKELEALYFTNCCGLDRINYYHFAGRRDFTKPFELLVAGCGTGDAVVSLAAQLYGSPASITALDMSAASLEVTRKRLEARGLDNVRLVHDSLLKIEKYAEKKFDYINCIGVLHHLEVPEAGLAALEKVLASDGVMHLMLYGLYGRECVYQLQKLMRIINGSELHMQRKLDMCRSVVAELPAQHGFRQFVERVADVKQYGDSGLYDLLLHSQDVAYTVPQVYDFLATSGLMPTHWHFVSSGRGNDLYRGEAYFTDDTTRKQVMALPLRERQAVAELMDAQIGCHEFFAARHAPLLPQLDDLEMVPHFDVCQAEGLAEELAAPLSVLEKGYVLQMNFGALTLAIHNGLYTSLLLRFLDGKRSLGMMFDEVRGALAAGEVLPDNAQLIHEFSALYRCFNRYDLMFLRHISVPPYRCLAELTRLRGALGGKQFCGETI